mgnify:CR=1 FL=1
MAESTGGPEAAAAGAAQASASDLVSITTPPLLAQ